MKVFMEMSQQIHFSLVETQKDGVSIGPRRMRYVETAMKFRNKIADEKGISTDHLKIVRVYRSQKETFKKIKKW